MTTAPAAIRVTLCLALLVIAAAATADAQPTFSKQFSPDTIGPGGVSRLTFTIDNSGGAPATALAFTDVLPTVPGAMTLADPANAWTDCADAILTASDGGDRITFSEGKLGAGASCTIRVDVTAGTPGTHQNITGNLTSSAGDSNTASDDLDVDLSLPGFSKSFAPSSVPVGGRSTLTFLVDNTANPIGVADLDFADNLPTGMEIADPANAVTDCKSPNPQLATVLTAVPGSTSIILDANGSTIGNNEVLPAGATCTVAVDVVATGIGSLDNISGDLLADFVSCGGANATLESTVTPIALRKDFTDDPVAPGGTVTLDFTVDNLDRDFPATDVAFTDDLTTMVPPLAGLIFDSVITNDCGGTVTGAGGTTIGLSGGTVGPGGSCTVSARLAVPGGAAPGAHLNTTNPVTATVDGSLVVGNLATDTLFIESAPIFTKEFVDDPVTGGDTVTLRFTITNADPTSSVTGIDFTDDIGGTGDPRAGALAGLAANILVAASGLEPQPLVDPCGLGSLLTIPDPNDSLPSPPFPAIPPDPTMLLFSGGSLAAAGTPGDSCTFDVTLDVPEGVPTGAYLNTTSDLTATPIGTSAAADHLNVVAAPSLRKEFVGDPVAPGDSVTLEFTLTHSEEASGDATGISFTDDLASVLTGLTANLPPTPSPPCGAGSALTGSAGDTLLTLTGGTLSPGESCTFSVNLDVPAGTSSGSYNNTTSGVSASVAGMTVTSGPASDDVDVSGLSFSKEFIGDPVVPGDTVTLRFTIENVHPTDSANLTFFIDDLADVLPGSPDLSVVAPLPTAPCGAGSTITGTTDLTYSGGTLLSGEICTFDVTVLVPAGAPEGEHRNVTSVFETSFGNSSPATDTLRVNSNLLQLGKEFTDDPVVPGSTATLRFTLTNLDEANSAAAVEFSDDLEATLAGLSATGLPLAACGGTVSGTGTLTFSGGTLGAGATCQFDVTVSVPGDASVGTYPNTTSAVTGTIAGFAVNGGPAVDDLVIGTSLLFSKSFDGPSTAAGTPVLTFTITNPGQDAESNIQFSDDLSAVISGLEATNLPLSDVCGAGSELSGTSFLTLTGANLPPLGGMCSFDVELSVPGAAVAGTFVNTTSDLTQNGLMMAEPATADLVIEPPPAFAKAFTPAVIALGQGTTLVFTIDNSASSVAADALDFTDNLPPGTVVATPANSATTCTGGTLTATAGSAAIAYTGGTVGAGATCTVQVDILASTVGFHVNTSGTLTSSSGDSGTAGDTLTVNPQAGFSKTFLPDAIAIDGASTLRFTVDNTGSTADATNLDFTDNLPAGVVVATPANAAVTCLGGTLTAASGSGTVSYAGGTVAAGASCTVEVDVTSSTAGSHVNTSGELTSSLGNSGTATDTLIVEEIAPMLGKSFIGGPVLRGGSIGLEFTITNTSPIFDLTDISFTDDLTAALAGLAATGLPANDICGAGSQLSGTSVLTLTGGNLAPSASCTFQVTLRVPAGAPLGIHTNTTSAMTAQSAGVPVSVAGAEAELEVVFLEFEKAFSDSPTPGGTVILGFTLTNPSASTSAQNIGFTDDLDAVIPGLEAVGLPVSACGGIAVAIPDPGTINFSGGSLAPGEVCSFEVTLQTPRTARPGDYTNTTSIVTASVAGQPVAGDAAGAASDVITLAARAAIPALGPMGSALLSGLIALIGVWLLAVRR